MARPLRVVQLGLGPIGRATASALLDRGDFRLVGAVDPDPRLAGRDLGSVLGMRRRLGLVVAPDLGALPRSARAALAFHTTVSSLAAAAPQIEAAVAAGMHVVSSTEELAFPWVENARLARRLDRRARAAGVVVHGTGVNPGFAMDVLALTLSHACLDLRHVLARRIGDAATRRVPLRLKVGAGMTPGAFRRRAREGSIGHVGLRESMQMVAAGLGWKLDRMSHRLAPVLAESRMTGPPVVEPGRVAGQKEVLRGHAGGREVLRFELILAMGAAEPRDEVILEGDPPLRLRIDGGTPGDTATVAALINAASRVAAAPAGLRTPLDLPLPRFQRRNGAAPAGRRR